MTDLYTTLQISPRKKRCPPQDLDDNILTPKKLRIAPPTPPSSVSRNRTRTVALVQLPSHVLRILGNQTALQHAVSHALATCAISPTSDSGLVRNVLNHLSLTTYSGLSTSFSVDDLKRLCWIWEWDGKSLPVDDIKLILKDAEDNPFLEKRQSTSGDWTRGSMGLVLSSTSHYSKSDRKRVPAYGIGIEVEMDLDKDMGGGMAAVARWTAAADKRRMQFRAKLERWVELHSELSSVPPVPLADLPQLIMTPKVSSLTRALASCSPKASSSLQKLPAAPPSPTSLRSNSPNKRSLHPFAVPFPISATGSISPVKKGSILFPQTPSRRNQADPAILLTPQTPSTTSLTLSKNSDPSTPVHQTGTTAVTAPQTPTTSRRQALYERIRQKSLSASPTKASSSEVTGGKLTRDQMLKMGQEEMRRRCLLGRLGGVAESVWMLFSTPVTGSSATPIARKRRALPLSEVATAIIKSSPVPISTAEANESLALLARLCPFFIKQLNIAGNEWLEMPASTSNTGSTPEASSTKRGRVLPGSPGARKAMTDIADELISRSPRRVKKEVGGLREVREIIRRELELQD